MGDSEHQAYHHIQRAEHLLEIKRPEQAIEHLERALSLQPQNAYILCSLSYAFFVLKDNDRALEYAKRATAADPNDEWSYRLQAHVHLRRDRRASAYKAATRAVEIDPESASCLYTLAQCAFHYDRVEEARVLGQMLIRQHPESTDGHRMLADIAMQEEDYAAAAAGYETVLDLDPQDDDAMARLASIRNKHNRYADSASLLRGAVHVDPTSEARRDNLRDSMARFALFGQAYERRKSVGALLVTVFMFYVALGFALAGYLEKGSLMTIAYMAGLPLLLLVGLPMLRGRFLKSQSEQLFALHRSISRQQRRRTLWATTAGLLAAYGIATIVYFDVGDPFAFAMPLYFVVWAMWLYMAAITLRLLTLWLSDSWVRLTKAEVPAAERRLPVFHVVMLIATAAALVLVFTTHSEAAALSLFPLLVVTGILYARRYPLGVAFAVFLAGIGLMAFDDATQPDFEDRTVGEFGFMLAAIGIAFVVVIAIRRQRKVWQRRRVAKLVGVDVEEFAGREARDQITPK